MPATLNEVRTPSAGVNRFPETDQEHPAPGAPPSLSNNVLENQRDIRDWGWSNTLKYIQQFDKHGVSVLVGQEISKSTNRFVQGQMSNLINTDLNSRYLQDALGDAATKTVFSNGGENALLSFFGKAEYNYANRYIATFTPRQDGSSNLVGSPLGAFPAVGLGWRLSQEGFMRDNKTFSISGSSAESPATRPSHRPHRGAVQRRPRRRLRHRRAQQLLAPGTA